MPTEREAIEAAKVLKEWCKGKADCGECIFDEICYGLECPNHWHIPETGEKEEV